MDLNGNLRKFIEWSVVYFTPGSLVRSSSFQVNYIFIFCDICSSNFLRPSETLIFHFLRICGCWTKSHRNRIQRRWITFASMLSNNIFFLLLRKNIHFYNLLLTFDPQSQWREQNSNRELVKMPINHFEKYDYLVLFEM